MQETLPITTRARQLVILRDAVLKDVILLTGRRVKACTMKSVLVAIDSRSMTSDEEFERTGEWRTCYASAETLARDTNLNPISVKRALVGLSVLCVVVETVDRFDRYHRRPHFNNLKDFKVVDYKKHKIGEVKQKSVAQVRTPGSRSRTRGSQSATRGRASGTGGSEIATPGTLKKKEEHNEEFTEEYFGEFSEMDSGVSKFDSLPPRNFERGLWRLVTDELVQPEIVQQCYNYAVEQRWMPETEKGREYAFALAAHFYRKRDGVTSPTGFFRHVLQQGLSACAQQADDVNDLSFARKMIKKLDGVIEPDRCSDLLNDRLSTENRNSQLMADIFRVLGDYLPAMTDDELETMRRDPAEWIKANESLFKQALLEQPIAKVS